MHLTRIGLSLLALASLAPATLASLDNTTVIIVRHAEKPEEGPNLTPAGLKRAAAYAQYFQSYKVDGKVVHFDHLFAAKDSKNSVRPRLTLTPLSEAMKMPLDQRFSDKDPDAIVQDLKQHSYGKDLLICWRHGKIPALLDAIGAKGSLIPGGKWPSDTYDWVVQLQFGPTGEVKEAKLIHEHLMPGDK